MIPRSGPGNPSAPHSSCEYFCPCPWGQQVPLPCCQPHRVIHLAFHSHRLLQDPGTKVYVYFYIFFFKNTPQNCISFRPPWDPAMGVCRDAGLCLCPSLRLAPSTGSVDMTPSESPVSCN